MCERGITTSVKVWIPADLSTTGKACWRWERIDFYIADIVKALQDGGINMRGSCCGDRKDFGFVVLQDGRFLTVCPAADYRSLRWALRAAWQIVRNKYLRKERG